MTLQELLSVLRNHLRLVILLPLLAALAVAGIAVFLPNQYTASTTMYVLVTSGDGSTATTTSNDLTASQMITNDVATLMKSDRVKADTASDLGLADLRGFKISVTSSTTSRVVTLSVTGSNAQSAADRIPGAKLVTIEDGGHMMLGHEERIRSEIVSFLKNYSATGS